MKLSQTKLQQLLGTVVNGCMDNTPWVSAQACADIEDGVNELQRELAVALVRAQAAENELKRLKRNYLDEHVKRKEAEAQAARFKRAWEGSAEQSYSKINNVRLQRDAAQRRVNLYESVHRVTGREDIIAYVNDAVNSNLELDANAVWDMVHGTPIDERV